MKFGDKLYRLRTHKGYSQEQIAYLLGVSRQTVSKWETAAVLPDIDKIIQLSELFHVTTDFLLKDSPEERNTDNLDRTIFRLLGSAQEMEGISKSLINIMQDGIIDEEEMVQMREILNTLDNLVEIISEVKIRMNIK